MDESLHTLGRDRSRPQHHFFAEQEQFRLKVQRFSNAPPEVTIQKITLERDVERYLLAAERGQNQVRTTRTRRQDDPDRVRDAESIERSQRRAKSMVRKTVIELAPTALVTFTTRKVYSMDDLLKLWDGAVRRMRQVVPGLEYCAVPEPHPSNPEHFHIHVAVRGKLSIDTLRRIWHITLEAHEGRRCTAILRGAASPGNIDVQRIKSREAVRTIRKIAKYIAKYITKDLVERFNRRRYWPSKGISVESAQVFWLDAVSQSDAIREGCEMLGHWNSDVGCPAFKHFMPSDRVFWYSVEPDHLPEPPF